MRSPITPIPISHPPFSPFSNLKTQRKAKSSISLKESLEFDALHREALKVSKTGLLKIGSLRDSLNDSSVEEDETAMKLEAQGKQQQR